MKKIKETQKRWLVAVGVAVIAYILSLFIPYVSNITKYPYYFVKCGGQPITASKFAASYTYTVPGDRAYEAFDTNYFCNESEAQSAGFRKHTITIP